MKPLLIIPAYNESDSILPLLRDLEENYTNYDYIVINDCSTDNTKELLDGVQAPYLDLPVNLGLSGGVRAGMQYALNKGYEVCIQIDGDGQHRPEYIDSLIQEVVDGADIAIGSRFLNKENQAQYKQTFLRTIGAKWISWLIMAESGLRLTDPTSGMRAYNRRALFEMVNDVNARPEPDTIAMLAYNGYKIKEVQVEMDERIAGVSHLSSFSAVKYMVQTTIAILFNSRRKVR